MPTYTALTSVKAIFKGFSWAIYCGPNLAGRQCWNYKLTLCTPTNLPGLYLYRFPQYLKDFAGLCWTVWTFLLALFFSVFKIFCKLYLGCNLHLTGYNRGAGSIVGVLFKIWLHAQDTIKSNGLHAIKIVIDNYNYCVVSFIVGNLVHAACNLDFNMNFITKLFECEPAN